ncbi:hypothetical protein BP6252_10417 [Coleophoma cylindrospora]|uniref:Uncharacterized protein n=1 Tax=Coleophoma cylindrospora TaxID=1849047 RepID=A0A3D8QSG2_9HELO|nr:hypothetical protein BP6252_10417 [Coleophoma cylindrospora]
MATATTKPKLAQLKTPMTSTFPSELSALSARSPLPGFADFLKQEEGIKTPITPPVAYTDFLKSMASPAPTPGEKSSGGSTPTSAPSTSSSEHSECSCSCETHKSPVSAAPPTPFRYPASAPSTARLARLRIPPSPSTSTIESPLSANATSAIRSPFSARSTRSPFDWDFKSKGRYFDVKSPISPRSSVRQVREIVTRTVTYTPRMSPAPKGKRRKLE